ncbi:hypothetical protein Csa_018206 [Cucumis sativus]|uniref:Uncharacterized protein n=1 Tax=Cucumis sativus TaxID=3659 RepID=A0A0A0K6W9_CUCSA|nr:hypothetical protein Csa_018206 [Cucumis sativus]
MEKFTTHCSSLTSSSSFFTQSRFNLPIFSTLLASIFFLTLRFSPSFFTLLLLLLIPAILFIANKKSNPLYHHLFDENPQTTPIQESTTQIGQHISSDDETSCSSSSNDGGLGSGDFKSDLWMHLDELTRNLPLSEDYSSSEDDDDDSLIEIPLLPNSNGIRNLETCLPNLLPDSVLRQHGFVELLEEINEEDNLIEIDISKGFNRFPTVCN